MKAEELLQRVLNRREIGQDQIALLRQDAGHHMDLLLAMLERGGLNPRMTENAVIGAFALLRGVSVRDEQRRRFAELLVRLAESPTAEVSARARSTAAAILGIDDLLVTPMFDRATIESLRGIADLG